MAMQVTLQPASQSLQQTIKTHVCEEGDWNGVEVGGGGGGRGGISSEFLLTLCEAEKIIKADVPV